MRYFFIICLIGAVFGLNGFLPTTPYEAGDTPELYRPWPDPSARVDDKKFSSPPSTDPKSVRNDIESNVRPGDPNIGRQDLGSTPGGAVNIAEFDDGV